MGLSLAPDLHACALAAEDPAVKAATAMALHRVSRSVRQSMALEAKLVRDLKRREAEARAEAVRECVRKAQVRVAVERMIWDDGDSHDWGLDAVERLDERLDEAALYEDFGEGPIETIIARLRADIGLEAGRVAEHADPHDPARRSSA